MRTIDDWNLSRRALLGALGVGMGATMLPHTLGSAKRLEATAITRAALLTIDISSEPDTLDPALTYAPNGWSIVHSVYDSLLQFDNEGNLELLLAESWSGPRQRPSRSGYDPILTSTTASR